MDADPNGRPPPGEPAERRAKFEAGRCRPHEPQLPPPLGVVQLSADARRKSPPRNPALRARLPPGAGAPPDGSPPQPGTAAPRPARLPSTRSPLRHVPSPGEMVSISTPISALSSARQPWARLGSARPDPQCRHAPPRPADWGLPCCPSAARSQCRAGAGRQGRGGGPPAPTRRSPGARVCCAVRCGAMLRCAMLCCAMLCTAVLCCAVQRGEGSGTPALRHRPQL